MTPLPTLEEEQANEIIQTFMQDAAFCETPCFLGIVPGKTTLGEALDIFRYLGLSPEKITYAGKSFYDVAYDFKSGLSISANMMIYEELVKNLTLDIHPEIQEAGFPREWLAFSPETLINRYGQPSKVEIAVDWTPRTLFELIMYFDEDNLIVDYVGYDITSIRYLSPYICPMTAQFDSVSLWMGEEPIYLPLEATPLEKATSMTIEEFSELMTGNPANACFDINDEASP